MLPEEVLRTAQEELLSWHGLGYSIMETSHRSEEFVAIMAETEQMLRRLLGIPPDYRVLLLQGGAHLQFSMVPLNLLGAKFHADYVLTGIWSEKAAEEARRFCDVHLAADNAGSERRSLILALFRQRGFDLFLEPLGFRNLVLRLLPRCRQRLAFLID